ncbi:MAG TPA: hypothetical protein PLV48_12780 [Rhodocyclaceae bacterium]|nr:hypothetical protein [Rhodocyclaceae bacterium]
MLAPIALEERPAADAARLPKSRVAIMSCHAPPRNIHPASRGRTQPTPQFPFKPGTIDVIQKTAYFDFPAMRTQREATPGKDFPYDKPRPFLVEMVTTYRASIAYLDFDFVAVDADSFVVGRMPRVTDENYRQRRQFEHREREYHPRTGQRESRSDDDRNQPKTQHHPHQHLRAGGTVTPRDVTGSVVSEIESIEHSNEP